MAKLKITVTDNIAQTAANFDKLTRAEQRAVVGSSKLGKEMDRTGRKAQKTAKSGQASFLKLGAVMAAAGAAGQIAMQGMAQEAQRVQREIRIATDEGRRFGDAMGDLVVQSGKNPEQIKQLLNAAKGIGTEFGIKDLAGITTSITEINNATGGRFSQDQIVAATSRAAKAKQVKSNIPLTPFASASLELQASQKRERGEVDPIAAENLLLGLSGSAREEMTIFIKELQKIIPTGLNTPIEEKGALMSFLTSSAGGAASSLVAGPRTLKLLERVGSITPKQLEEDLGLSKAEAAQGLAGATNAQKLINLAERTKGGEFKLEDVKTILAKDEIPARAAVEALVTNTDQLKKLITQVSGPQAGSLIDKGFQTAATVDPLFETRIETNRQEAAATLAALENKPAQSVGEATQQLDSFAKRIGMIPEAPTGDLSIDRWFQGIQTLSQRRQVEVSRQVGERGSGAIGDITQEQKALLLGQGLGVLDPRLPVFQGGELNRDITPAQGSAIIDKFIAEGFGPAARLAVESGGVSAAGGLNQAEQQTLIAAGVSQERVTELLKLIPAALETQLSLLREEMKTPPPVELGESTLRTLIDGFQGDQRTTNQPIGGLD